MKQNLLQTGKEMMGFYPPLGWNSWNTFTWDINEQLIKDVADVFVEQGYKDAGYEYIVIDDCWSLKQRDENGDLVADPEKFPSGMKALADYIHSKGLKFGMYSCVGTNTCAGYPGSFEHEMQDAKKLAEWEVDYLKYDFCFKPRNIDGELLYRRMGIALKNCGRDILFSACNWGSDAVHNWIRTTGSHMYRSTGDIQDKWDSIKNIALSQMDKAAFTGNFCHNDMDMLVVGMYGGSNDAFIGKELGGCTEEEYRTHFSLWCMMGSPLMMGCDVRKAQDSTKAILQNKYLLQINQDPEARGCFYVKPEPQWFPTNEVFMLAKILHDGKIAIGFFNLSDQDRDLSLQFWDLGMTGEFGRHIELFDCWKQEKIGVFSERYVAKVPKHACQIVLASLQM